MKSNDALHRYEMRMMFNKSILALFTILVYCAAIWLSGIIFEGMLLMSLSGLTENGIESIVLAVRVFVFISLTIGMVNMSFLKVNKDSLLMSYGPMELQREINVLESAKERYLNRHPNEGWAEVLNKMRREDGEAGTRE